MPILNLKCCRGVSNMCKVVPVDNPEFLRPGIFQKSDPFMSGTF